MSHLTRSSLRISQTYPHQDIRLNCLPDEKRQKPDPKLEKCILVGYLLEQNWYRCYNPSTRKVRVSRDVVFDESFRITIYNFIKYFFEHFKPNSDILRKSFKD